MAKRSISSLTNGGEDKDDPPNQDLLLHTHSIGFSERLNMNKTDLSGVMGKHGRRNHKVSTSIQIGSQSVRNNSIGVESEAADSVVIAPQISGGYTTTRN